MLSLQD